MSLVLSSLGKPVRERMRVTQAESWERAAAIVARDCGVIGVVKRTEEEGTRGAVRAAGGGGERS